MTYSSVAVDLVQPNNMTRVHAVQGDTGRGLLVFLTVNGQQVLGDQIDSAILCVQRPDGYVKRASGSFVSEQNCWQFDTTAEMLAREGSCHVAIKTITSGAVVTSPAFIMEVHKNANSGLASPEFILYIRRPSDEIPLDDEEGGDQDDPLLGGQ